MVPIALPVFITVMLTNNYWHVNYYRTQPSPHDEPKHTNNYMKAGKQD